jgi:hypothetical protein
LTKLAFFEQGIGLSVEEAVVFWRKSFSTITDDKFNKEYKYNVRHNYGLEGSRKNYNPKKCVLSFLSPLLALTDASPRVAAAPKSSPVLSPAPANVTVVLSVTTPKRASPLSSKPPSAPLSPPPT